jgi:sugar lactone lactonase YvrE
MTFRSHLRTLAAAALAAALSVTLVAPAEARPRQLDRIDLPVGFQPEGIAIGKGPHAYVGSLADGDIYRANLRTGKGRVISQGPGTPSVGLKLDRRGRLYVAGGPSGTARIVNLKTGNVTSYTLTSGPSFINDVVLTRKAAWFTNSAVPELYRLSRGKGKRSEPTVTTLPLSGEFVQPSGLGANGIAQTPDRRALLVVAGGILYRVNKETGAAKRVYLGGYVLTNGDGLLVRGRTLYVVQNRLSQVAVFKLNRRGTAGDLVKTLPVPESDVPTTVAAYRGSLYLPNARFGNANPDAADYWISRIDR